MTATILKAKKFGRTWKDFRVSDCDGVYTERREFASFKCPSCKFVTTVECRYETKGGSDEYKCDGCRSSIEVSC